MTERIRRVGPELIGAFGLVLAAVLQDPGRIIRDSKLQLALDPGGLFSTGLHLWDPSAGMGQVPNQAAGYLFPMTPIFWLGETLGVPPWLGQRFWLGALLVTAYAGTVLLARELAIGSRATRILAGLFYALSPAALSLIGFQSATQTGFALLPLALWPLVRGSVRGSPRRAAAASVLVVVAMGGANAASVVAVLVLPALWLVTRTPGPRRRALIGWWCGGLAVATLWWTGPLLLQGRYGLDFAAVTETAGLTTGATSMAEVIRGAGTWTSYLVVDGRVWVPAGWSIATDVPAIIAGATIAALGLFGLARRDLPSRLPLVLGFLFGVSVMALGWVGPYDSPVAQQFRSLLDGPLAPFRNIHKFTPLVSLPLALGVAHGARLATARLATGGYARLVQRGGAAAVALGVVVTAGLPATTGLLPLDGSFDAVPDHWQEAADWIDDHTGDDDGRTLLVPGANFGQYEWGRPFDEPFDSMADSAWAVRNLVPLGGAGSTRLLDGIENLLAGGRPSDGLAPVLSRAGIRYVLTRNDLDLTRVTSPPPVVVRHVLEESPGIRLVASFGEPVSAGGDRERRLVPDAIEPAPLAPLDIYEVTGSEAVAVSYPTSDRVEITGGAESLIDLATAVELDTSAVVVSADIPESATLEGGTQLLTDGSQRRDVTYGRVHDRRSYVLTPEEDAPMRGGAVTGPAAEDRDQAVARYDGLAEIRSSSYANGAQRLPETMPYAAVDGAPTTSWRVASNRSAIGQWIELRFDEERSVDDLTLQLPPAQVGRGRIVGATIETDSGTVEADLTGPGDRRPIAAPEGPTRRLRITISAAAGQGAPETAGIAEIGLPDLTVERTLVLPDLDSADSAVLVRSLSDPYDLSREDEELGLDRTLRLGSSGPTAVRGTAVARPGPRLLDGLADRLVDGDVDLSASSVWGSLPEFAAWHAMDDDPSTAWLSDPANPTPTLSMAWDGARPIEAVTLRPVPGSGPVPATVVIDTAGVERTVSPDESGRASLPLTITDELNISFPPGDEDEPAGFVALAEVTVDGLEGLTAGRLDAGTALDRSCTDDLGIDIDGTARPVRMDGTVRDLVELAPIAFTGCGPAPVDGDEVRVRAPGSSTVAVNTLVLGDEGAISPADEPRRVDVLDWSTAARSVSIDEGAEAFLAVNEGFNEGWQAELDGERLAPVRLDGWRQGFVVPAGPASTIDLSFSPDRWYGGLLVAGLLGVLTVLVLALKPDGATPGPAPLSERSPTARVVLIAVTALTALISGALVVLVLPLWLLPGRQRALPIIAAAAYAIVGLSIASQPGLGGAAFDAGPQMLAVLAVAAVGLSLADEPRPPATARTADRPDPASPAQPG